MTAHHSVQSYTRASGAQLGLAVGSIFSPAARAVCGLAQSGLGVLFLRYGRDAELQADRLGAQYAGETGWDPTGVRDMLSTLSRLSEGGDSRGVPGWLATHPAGRTESSGLDRLSMSSTSGWTSTTFESIAQAISTGSTD